MNALSTDLYELTMMAGYYAGGMVEPASFELFVRELPARRAYLVAAGLDQALDYLEGLRFTSEEIAWLRTVPALSRAPRDFFERHLREFRFTGEVWAVPEGTPVFALEPLVRVRAPLPEAQFVETALLSILMFQTAIASKATRVVEAARGRPIIEFGGRRAHGIEAAVLAARAACVAGCRGTSNVEAGRRFGLELSGTMAHSWVMAHGNEVEAFRRFASIHGDLAVLLIDTYDTVEAARRVVQSGLRPAAVRLDSGDIATLSRAVRSVLDAGGLTGTRIFVSGDLDEDRVSRLVTEGAPVDAFGVGTALSTSSDAPALGGVYKLVEIERSGRPVPVMKLSAGKRTYPSRKQIWRVFDAGVAGRDVLGLADEPGPAGGEPLLEHVMHAGRRLGTRSAVAELRDACLRKVGSLPASVRRLDAQDGLPVEISERLGQRTERLERQAGRGTSAGVER